MPKLNKTEKLEQSVKDDTNKSITSKEKSQPIREESEEWDIELVIF